MENYGAVIVKLVDFLIVLLLAAMTLVVALSVFYRYVLVKPIYWAEEFSRYCHDLVRHVRRDGGFARQ